jgi:WD40 repeat protein
LMVDRDPATHEETVEVAHEAILRRWRQLRTWLEESRADVRMQRQLANSAAEWLAAQRDPSFLLRGAQLQQFEEWEKRSSLILAGDERAFLEASILERKQQNAVEVARQGRERALEQRVRYFLVAMIVMLLVAVVTEIFLVLRVQHEVNRAQALALAADAQLALKEANPDLSLQVAIEAIHGGEAHYLLHTITSAARSVALSPDGRRLLSGSSDGMLILWDVAPDSPTFGQAIHHLQGHTAAAMSLAFSPDGIFAISGGCGQISKSTCTEGELILWRVDSGELVRRFHGHDGWVWSLAFSPNGQFAISGAENGELIIWDVAAADDMNTADDEALTYRFRGHTTAVRSVSFSPDGCRILSTGSDNSLILWDVAEHGRLQDHCRWCRQDDYCSD